jgi:hypothetical protein
LCVTHTWELIFHIRFQGPFYPYHSQSFSRGPALCAKGQIKVPQKNMRNDIFYPGVCDTRLGHTLFTWFFLSRLSHSHRKQQYFVYPSYIPTNCATNLRSHNFHLNLSYLIFTNSSLMLP